MEELRKVMLRTRREKVSLMSGGPDLPKCDIAGCFRSSELSRSSENKKNVRV